MGDLSLSDIKSGGIRVQILTEQPKVNCGFPYNPGSAVR
jgi:hypothetical protein